MQKSIFLKILSLAVIFPLIISFAWVGYIASDDMMYISAATDWIGNFPYIPPHHFGVRHTLTLPMAVVFWLFGSGEYQAVLVGILYFIALLILLYLFLVQQFDNESAFITIFLLILTPLFAVQATILGVDIPEAFYYFSSLLLFFKAVHRNGEARMMFFVGLLAGLAFLNRETACALMLLYGVLFLGGFYIERKRYFLIFIGFTLPIFIEMIYYLIVVGDPLHRFHIVLSTHGSPAMTLLGSVASGTGNLTESRLFGPIVAMFFNQEFGLLYWFAIPAVWFTCIKPFGTVEQRRFLRTLLIMCLIIFVFYFYFLGLRPLPRYFSTLTVAILIIVVIWLWRVVYPQHRRMAYILIVTLIASNLLMIDLENKQPRLAERELVDRLAANPDLIIYVDPKTYGRAMRMLQWSHISLNRAIVGLPPPSSLYLFSKENVSTIKSRENGDSDDLTLLSPKKDWVEIDRSRGKKTVVGTVLTWLRLDRWIIDTPLERVIWANQPIILYKRLEAAL